MSSPSENTRSRILRTARELLETGQPATMSRIARAAGVSRQALYLHFDGRAELLIAVTREIDAAFGVDRRLEDSRAAATGQARLAAFIRFWAAYLPDIQNVARALLALRETDAEAAAAWSDRMQALREGCAVAIAMLARDRQLNPVFSEDAATDLLWTMLSFDSWDTLVRMQGWSPEDYAEWMQACAFAAFVRA